MNIRYSYDNQVLIACGHNSSVKTFELNDVFLKNTYESKKFSDNFVGNVKIQVHSASKNTA